MLRMVEEVFLWMFEDERWRYKLVAQALILLVPVAGQVALLGWAAATYEELAAGRQDMARCGLHLGRGARMLAMAAVYWVGLGVPYALLRDLEGPLGRPRGLLAAAQVYNDAALLLYVVLFVPVLAATADGGLRGGIDVVRIGAGIAAHPLRTALATIVVLLAFVIASVGIALIVTAPFALVYAAAVVASVAAWWSAPERRSRAQPAPAAPAGDGIPVPFRPPQVDGEPTSER